MEGRVIVNPKAIAQKLEKFKYPALILLLGLTLILWPSKQKQPEAQAPVPEQVESAPSVEEKMEEILSCIDGAGKVRVLLTLRTGDETVYQTDTTSAKGPDSESRSVTTVMAGSEDVPVVRQTVYGQYRGALIVCQGADSPAVRLQLVNAVAGLTGLPADRITVIKMKS